MAFVLAFRCITHNRKTNLCILAELQLQWGSIFAILKKLCDALLRKERCRKGEKVESQIRKMTRQDQEAVLEMMRVFYASPAVLSNGSEEIFAADIENCVNDNPYLEGYVFESLGELQGYAMIAKSYSTEFGKPCIWIEDLYLKEQYRGLGLGSRFFDFITKAYPDCLFRLEVEEENRRAIRVYEKNGFTVLPYTEMKR